MNEKNKDEHYKNVRPFLHFVWTSESYIFLRQLIRKKQTTHIYLSLSIKLCGKRRIWITARHKRNRILLAENMCSWFEFDWPTIETVWQLTKLNIASTLNRFRWVNCNEKHFKIAGKTNIRILIWYQTGNNYVGWLDIIMMKISGPSPDHCPKANTKMFPEI